MGLEYRFIPSTSELTKLSGSDCVPIRFVSLLTSIKYNDTHILLQLQNFANGQPEKLPHLVKLRCTDRNAERLARMTVSLICQRFNIESPELDSDERFIIENIHIKSLCFLKCNGLYMASGAKYSVFLEGVKTLDLSMAMEEATNKTNTPEGKVISDTFHNLIKMNKDPKEPFKFVNLANYSKKFANFIKEIELIKSNSEEATILKNPIFGVTRFLCPPEESQDDFNSQCMGTGGTFDTMGLDPIEESDSSMESSSPAGRAKKRCKLNDIPKEQEAALRPEMMLYGNIGALYHLTGKVVGIYPSKFDRVEDYNNCNLRLYFIPKDWNTNDEKMHTLVPNVNCIEIVIQKSSPIHEMFRCLIKGSEGLETLLMHRDISLQIQRSKWELKDSLYSCFWSLQNLNQQDILLSNVKLQSKSKTLKRDPLIKFRDLTINSYEVKFVTMIGLLVSCTFESTSYTSMVFTDFTDNTSISQKFLFDRFLIDFDNKIESYGGFRTIMYPNQFDEFNDLIIKDFNGVSIRQMFQEGTGENLSHRGIVCKISLKLKMFNDKLNAIMRECIPLTKEEKLTQDDEITQLNEFYESAMRRLKQISIRRYYDFYSKCFPLVKTTDGFVVLRKQKTHEHLIPSLNVDISMHELKDGSNIPKLNAIEKLHPTLYKVEGQILGIEYRQNHLELLITNDIISKDFIDPTRILRIEIFSSKNLKYFFNKTNREIDDNDIETLKNLSLGEEFTFKIARGLIQLTQGKHQIGLMIWSPVECTYEEMKSQLRQIYNNNDNNRHPSDSLLQGSTIKVKQELA